MKGERKRLFLAGATGLVGTSLLDHISDQYPTLQVKASYCRSNPHLMDKRVEYLQGDLRSLDVCRKMARHCDCAVMAAANTSGAEILRARPWEQINDNIIMNIQMLKAFHLEGVRRIIFISSTSVYSESQRASKEDEIDFNTDPQTSYFGVGWTYRYLEKLCRFWHDRTGMEIVIIRASNIFGPYARFDPATSNFVPAIVRKAVEKADPFEVWGRPDVTRDVLFAPDFSRAVAMMLGHPDIRFDVFNVGSGAKTTVEEVVRWALHYALHKPSKIRYDAARPTTVLFRQIDCSKIKKVLGWQPENTVEEGIQKTVAWWMENRGWWKR